MEEEFLYEYKGSFELRQQAAVELLSECFLLDCFVMMIIGPRCGSCCLKLQVLTK